MKEVSKLRKIYEGFFGEEVPENIAADRRSKCAGCEFNSVNAEKLSLINNIRSKFTPPFCTLCDCQIHEKTGSPLEECAMYKIGEEKKWFKIKIETMEKEDLNLIQVGENLKDIEISGNEFHVKLGKVSAGEDTTMELLLQAKEGMKLDFQKAVASCGCTKLKTEVVDDRTVKITYRIIVENTGMGSQSKSSTVYYNMGGKTRIQVIKFKFFRVK